MKSAPNYASKEEDMTNLIIWARVRAEPFHWGMASFSESKIAQTLGASAVDVIVMIVLRFRQGQALQDFGETGLGIVVWLLRLDSKTY